MREFVVLVGPVFTRELITQPRRSQHFILRTAYPAALYILICTAWMVLAGTQLIRNLGDMARFGALLFQLLASLQLAIVTFRAATAAAAAVAQEKDKQTFILLLMTQLSNHEVVLGKLFAALLDVFVMFLAAVPLFMLLPLFGGVDFRQVVLALLVTAATILVAGSIGSFIALAREKTFQTLSMTVLVLVAWFAVVEGGRIVADQSGNASLATLLASLSPWQALQGALQPFESVRTFGGWRIEFAYMLFALLATVVINGVAIARLRVWNPGRETFQRTTEESAAAASETAADESPADARLRHVDARVRTVNKESRPVWDNPILWRETQTRAHGTKMIIIRTAYVALAILTLVALHSALQISAVRDQGGQLLPPAVQVLTPFFVMSVVIVNALAVTSITNERDGKCLELLVVTDLLPSEFVFGKMGGVAWVTKEMVLLPIALAFYVWLRGGMNLEDLVLTTVGMLVMNLFAIMLGVHYGTNYANSRTAIGVSLGTVFFLFLGVVTLIALMISFSGSFHTQLAPFLAFIVGGSVGLYVALGSRNPSSAIMGASLALPAATFFAVTSFLLGHHLTVFLLIAATYGFTTTALLVPALSEYNFAMGRSRSAEE